MKDKTNSQPYVPAVSIIVPIYNTKDYLEKCLNSLRAQTMHNIEIILIDDGSTDGSGAICDYFTEEDFRFKVKHKINEGLAAARNDGLKMAHAEYIMFVDSDDWVESNFCELPYCIAEEHEADLIIFQYITHRKGKENKRRPFPLEGVISKEEVLTQYWSFASSVTWNKLYKRELFYGITYPIGHLSEDGAVTHRLVYNAKTIYLINEYLYHYHLGYRSESITGTRSKQLIIDTFTYGRERINDIKQWGYNNRNEEKKLALLYLIVCGRYAEYSSYYSKILRADFLFPHNASSKQKIMYWIYKVSPVLFDLVSKCFGLRAR